MRAGIAERPKTISSPTKARRFASIAVASAALLFGRASKADEKPIERELRILPSFAVNIFGAGKLNIQGLGESATYVPPKPEESGAVTGPMDQEYYFVGGGLRFGITLDLFQVATLNYRYGWQSGWSADKKYSIQPERASGAHTYAELENNGRHSFTLGIFPILEHKEWPGGLFMSGMFPVFLLPSRGEMGLLIEAGLTAEKNTLSRGWGTLSEMEEVMDSRNMSWWLGYSGGIYFSTASYEKDAKKESFWGRSVSGIKIGLEVSYYPSKLVYILPTVEFLVGTGL
jgi:hypothetical protein